MQHRFDASARPPEWVDFAHLLANASDDLLGDKEAMLAAVSVAGNALSLCKNGLEDDLDLAKAAVLEDPEALNSASLRLRGSRELVLLALANDGSALRYAVPELQNDKGFILEAIETGEDVLPFASEELRGDRDVVFAAVRQHGDALLSASSAFKSDAEVILAALTAEARSRGSRGGQLMKHAAPELWEREDFVLRAMRTQRTEFESLVCYRQAARSVQARFIPRVMISAMRSVLACQGEDAPVVTVALSSPQEEDDKDKENVDSHASPTKEKVEEEQEEEEERGDQRTRNPATKASSSSKANTAKAINSLLCEATLLSGKTFFIKFPDAVATTANHLRRPEMIVNELGKALLAELPKHVEAKCPTRVFLMFAVADGDGVVVTPWESRRSLSEFLPS